LVYRWQLTFPGKGDQNKFKIRNNKFEINSKHEIPKTKEPENRRRGLHKGSPCNGRSKGPCKGCPFSGKGDYAREGDGSFIRAAHSLASAHSARRHPE
jgi:hypothetical protein